jgi:hypothetical protein
LQTPRRSPFLLLPTFRPGQKHSPLDPDPITSFGNTFREKPKHSSKGTHLRLNRIYEYLLYKLHTMLLLYSTYVTGNT